MDSDTGANPIVNIFDTTPSSSYEPSAPVRRDPDMNVEKALMSKVRNVQDYPRPGVVFRDISPLLEDGEAFATAVTELANRVSGIRFDRIVGVEARGFIIGSALAFHMKKGFTMARKKGKLPFKTVTIGYELEYGPDAMEMHVDSLQEGSRVLIVDDLLATGGTVKAAADLVKSLNATVAGLAFMIEIGELGGRESLEGYEIESLMKY